MSKSKSRIALALALSVVSAAPALAWRMNGPEWLTMMQKIREDRATAQESPSMTFRSDYAAPGSKAIHPAAGRFVPKRGSHPY